MPGLNKDVIVIMYTYFSDLVCSIDFFNTYLYIVGFIDYRYAQSGDANKRQEAKCKSPKTNEYSSLMTSVIDLTTNLVFEP